MGYYLLEMSDGSLPKDVLVEVVVPIITECVAKVSACWISEKRNTYLSVT
jgi:hypothetical protein